MNEKDAIAQLKRGDVRGLETLVRKYQLEAVRVAQPITNDLGLAEEIVQEAFVRVYQHIDQFDETRPFRPWFLRIVVNDALKLAEQQRRLVSLDSAQPSETATDSISLDDRLTYEQDEFGEKYDDAEMCQEILSGLSPEHRAVLELKYYLEMTDEEIADTIQIPPGTVKSRLHAAKLQIRSLLKRLSPLVLI